MLLTDKKKRGQRIGKQSDQNGKKVTRNVKDLSQ